MRRPAPLADSLSTYEATVSVRVVRPQGARDEVVRLEVDRQGALSLDDGAVDVVIEMLEAARKNLGARRRAG